MFVRFDLGIRQGYSPVSKRSPVSFATSPRQSFNTRTNYVYIRVSSSGGIVLVGVGESIHVLVSQFGLGANTSEAPRGVCPNWMREYHRIARESDVFTE